LRKYYKKLITILNIIIIKLITFLNILITILNIIITEINYIFKYINYKNNFNNYNKLITILIVIITPLNSMGIMQGVPKKENCLDPDIYFSKNDPSMGNFLWEIDCAPSRVPEMLS
jgi:hypothetical protein